ncbi:PREDICTED: splicing regulatory glutamine/lysine-rich protein 1-like [Amphimedon queenslandica]|uniref:RRM domain-containing protein n=1 Tax=Amphimedon queenslandica TaxID=400682 RepID=A0AAN0JM90_AMPQE|nr:PREDICTED: splicing regulatory glutamine/lysine-rich protein 1-like [Amphimedon queenslandica]|eukprot:XP_019857879.1 PREDICTED: splicing regulatory glutamine/lysine-rich protein 1-like [Amphimedon queenslandica]
MVFIDFFSLPEDENKPEIPSKVCFVTYKERESVETALHLSNTVFIDRALVVAQSRFEIIPEKPVAMSLAAPAVAVAFIDKSLLIGSGVNSGPLLPTPQTSLLGTPQMLPNPLASAFQQAQAVASSITANIQSQDPFSAADSPTGGSTGQSAAAPVLPSMPPITGNVDPSKIDEIRRTIYVGNLSSTLHADQVMNFFLTCGEIKYVRMAGDEMQPTRFAFVEFANPESVQVALQYNGAMFGDRPIKVNHSKNAIVKPQGKAPDVAQREVDEAMRKVRQASHSITNVIEPGANKNEEKEKRSCSKSHSRSRSRERRHERRRHRSPSPYERRKRRSYSRSPRRYSRNWRDYRGGSGYKRGHRSRSRTPPRHSYHSHRSSYRHRSPDKDRRRHSRSRSRSRSHSPRRKSSSRRKERVKDYSYSPSPERRRSSKKSKKDKKHKRRSPSVSPSVSPPPRKRGGSDKGEGEEEEEMEEEEEFSDGSAPSEEERQSSPSASE